LSVVYFTDRNLGKQFPEILRAAGLTVERHDDHFGPSTPDAEWLQLVGRRRWIAITRDLRIRYKKNELDAIIAHRVAMLAIVGKAPFADLARSFVATERRIERFVANHSPPYIAKVYRASMAELEKNPSASGRVELWYSPRGWTID
jgi:hypothetical protein